MNNYDVHVYYRIIIIETEKILNLVNAFSCTILLKDIKDNDTRETCIMRYYYYSIIIYNYKGKLL